MTELAVRSIAALRANHDELEGVVTGLTPDQLTGPSGASEWTIADTLSHLGSGAEITLATLSASLSDGDAEKPDNQSIWDRWNAASPEEQASWFLEHDARLVAFTEGISAEQRESAGIDMGFLPEPVSLDVALGMRLNEVAAHAWDVRVGLDPSAALRAGSAELLAEHFAGGLAFLLGFSTKPDQLSQQAVVALDGYELAIDESVRVVPGQAEGETATFSGPLESAIRLLSGRLKPEYTPAGVEVTGNVTLDDLRRVFPGY
ncbi:MAG: hypothetical protein JWR90_3651 [Marmoricola sp.]|nr:hypothetical protein [Marmoricola sp.]